MNEFESRRIADRLAGGSSFHSPKRTTTSKTLPAQQKQSTGTPTDKQTLIAHQKIVGNTTQTTDSSRTGHTRSHATVTIVSYIVSILAATARTIALT